MTKHEHLATPTWSRSLVALSTFPSMAAGESFPLSAHHSANQRGREASFCLALFTLHSANGCDLCLSLLHTHTHATAQARTHHFHPLCPNKNCLFKSAQILVRSKKTFYSAAERLSFAPPTPPLPHPPTHSLSLSPVDKDHHTNFECTAECACKHMGKETFNS